MSPGYTYMVHFCTRLTEPGRLDSNSTHRIHFDKVSLYLKEKHFILQKVRETLEISRHSNFNRDGGWSVDMSK